MCSEVTDWKDIGAVTCRSRGCRKMHLTLSKDHLSAVTGLCRGLGKRNLEVSGGATPVSCVHCWTDLGAVTGHSLGFRKTNVELSAGIWAPLRIFAVALEREFLMSLEAPGQLPAFVVGGNSALLLVVPCALERNCELSRGLWRRLDGFLPWLLEGLRRCYWSFPGL